MKISSQQRHHMYHLLSYYLIWFACLYTAAHQQAWIGIVIGVMVISGQLTWQFQVLDQMRHLLSLIFLVTLTGMLVDSAMIWLNIIVYKDNYFYPYFCPLWIVVLWIEFSIVIHLLLRPLWVKPMLTGFLALIGFSLAYFAAERMGAAHLVYGVYSAFIVGLIWMLLLPALLFIHHRREQYL